MDNTRLTISCKESREGDYEIDVTFERDSRIKFKEAFISLDRPMPPYLIKENDINGVQEVTADEYFPEFIHIVFLSCCSSSLSFFIYNNQQSLFKYKRKPPKICGD